MNAYELILIFDPGMGEDKIGTAVAKIEDKIKAGKGEIARTEKWGIKKLASMMKKAKKLTQGYYILIRFSAPSSVPGELKSYLKVTESIVRYFISRAVEVPVVEEKVESKTLEAVNVGEIQEERQVGKP